MVLAGFIWPYANEAHVQNVAQPPFSDGPYPSQLSDSYLNRLITKGVPPEEALEQYLALDIGRATHVDRVFELYMDRQRERDAKTGFDLAPAIEAHIRTEPLFLTPHHPNARLFGIVAQQLFESMKVPGDMIETAIASLRRTPFPPDELPIHPGIIRHFGLTFADAETRYSYFDEGRFTFSEYVLRYMRYESNHDLREGIALATDGDPQRVLGSLERGLQRSPGSLRGLRAKGMVLDRLGRRDEALTAYREAIAAGPDETEGHIALARFLLGSGDIAGARFEARKAVALDPLDAAAHAALAEVEVRADDAAALPPAREAARLIPGRTDYQQRLGIALMLAGDLDEARRETEKLLLMEPAMADPRNLLAEIHETQGRRAAAIAVLLEGIALGIENGQTYSLLGNFRLRDGELELAEAAFRHGVEIAPDRPDLQVCLDKVRVQQDERRRADA